MYNGTRKRKGLLFLNLQSTKTLANGAEMPRFGLGVYKMTERDETLQAIDKARGEIESGSLQVFDTSKFTVNGEEVTEAMIDMDADFVPDNTNAISDGYYHESFYKSAPAFDLRIDGITLVNEAY